ncbi:hypothetical protein [Pseudomonas sp. URMO17WK12:I11]|uniref:hypothetical protein n=1 Tax=Pseudomonas sp. URMO17WK12:I11 TaxID=1283291 RepID=UPI00119F35A3|nr:hypothetical protein [Pseudomonas sp. URMO17WK12:I11]
MSGQLQANLEKQQFQDYKCNKYLQINKTENLCLAIISDEINYQTLHALELREAANFNPAEKPASGQHVA